jgi:hypothetical protein
MSHNIPNLCHSIGAVTGATGVPIFQAGQFPTWVRNGAGDFSCTFSAADQYDSTQAGLYVQARGAVPLKTAVEQVSDTVKRVRFFGAADAPTDADFDWHVLRGAF